MKREEGPVATPSLFFIAPEHRLRDPIGGDALEPGLPAPAFRDARAAGPERQAGALGRPGEPQRS
jgi:hypothetical protein